MRNRLSVLIVAITLLLPGLALAQADLAESVHKAALQAANNKQWGSALKLWKDAIRLHPAGKYALNACVVLDVGLHKPVDAWSFCARAGQLGVDAANQKLLAGARARLSKQLSKDHAHIQILLKTPGASVTRDGTAWSPPFDTWVKQASSRLRVTREGFDPLERDWAHPIGTETRLTVGLAKARGTLMVTGGPRGASLHLGDRAIGTLPMKAPVRLEPGDYTVTIRMPGYEEAAQPVTVRSGKKSLLEVVLKTRPRAVPIAQPKPIEVPVISTPAAPGNDLLIAGWAIVATGAVALGAGGGLWAISKGVEDDLNDLSSSEARILALGSEQAYYDYFDAENQKRKDMDLGGTILLGVGGAALVTGAVLLLLDATSSPESDDSLLGLKLQPLTGPITGVSASVGF